MLRHGRRVQRWLVRAVLAFVAAFLTYVVGFWVIGLVPVNTDHVQPPTGIAIWVMHRGVHLDFVVPVRNEIHDWMGELSFFDFDSVPPDPSHLIVGWGDRGFFVDAPHWVDLRPSTALRAMSYFGKTALHCELMSLPLTCDTQRRVVLTPQQYRALVDYIRSAFARDAVGRVQPIAGLHYGEDAFYEAVGAYGLFHSCNTWVNEGLRRIGVRTAWWAIFGSSVMRHLPPVD